MNFEMAAEMYEGSHATVLTNDDVAVENSTWTTGRRGVAGTVIVEKIVGAAAEAGADLATLQALGDARQRPHPLDGRGADLAAPSLRPASPPSTLAEDEMEMGVGIHGEPGRRRVKLQPADAIAEEMLGAITGDLAAAAGGEVLLLVNGFGGTPSMELYLMYDAARRVLEAKGLQGRALAGRQLLHLARHGRLLAHRHRARRRAARAVGRAGAYGGAALVGSGRTYVLLHGNWHGGWCWARVADGLRALGHRVLTPTQTGLGERRHLLSPAITLDTFIDDLVNVIEAEELGDVILVGPQLRRARHHRRGRPHARANSPSGVSRQRDCAGRPMPARRPAARDRGDAPAGDRRAGGPWHPAARSIGVRRGRRRRPRLAAASPHAAAGPHPRQPLVAREPSSATACPAPTSPAPIRRWPTSSPRTAGRVGGRAGPGRSSPPVTTRW